MTAVRGVRALLRRLAGRDAEGFVVSPERLPTDGVRHGTVLFFREFGRFQGGHLKVWHYYNHVAASGTHVPYVAFTADSRWDDSNPWNQPDQRVVPASEVALSPDVLFLGARDWARIDPSQRHASTIPVINLVQNARHADASDESYGYLEHKAVRICIDPAVTEAVRSTGLVRGPIFTIPDGIDVDCVEEARTTERPIDVLVVGTKRPEMARRLHDSLASQHVVTKLIDRLVPRDDLLEDMLRARVTLMLPNPREGAYLPPLEAMASASLVVCPDIVGASYCVDGRNCLRPAYEEDPMIEAAERALMMDETRRQVFIDEGFRTVRTLSLDAERASFLEILGRVDDLWRDEA